MFCLASRAARRHRSAAQICSGQANGFSSDYIAIEISSPDCPDLTLIDLPGIVRTAVSGQSQGVITEVRETRAALGLKPVLSTWAPNTPEGFDGSATRATRGYLLTDPVVFCGIKPVCFRGSRGSMT